MNRLLFNALIVVSLAGNATAAPKNTAESIVKWGMAFDAIGLSNNSDDTGNSGKKLELTADENSKRVSMKWGYDKPQSQFTIELSAPISSTSNANSSHFGGLNVGNMIKLNYSKTMFSLEKTSFTQMMETCEQIKVKWVKEQESNLGCSLEEQANYLINKQNKGPLSEDDADDYQNRQSLGPVSIAPTIQYDNIADVTGVTVPVYVFRSKDDEYTGGFKLDWSSKKDDVTFGIFVDSAFSFF